MHLLKVELMINSTSQEAMLLMPAPLMNKKSRHSKFGHKKT
jgi:hypothetical protein